MIHPNEILLQKVDFLSKDIANQLYGKSIERVKNRRKLTFVKSFWYLNRLQNLGGFKGFKIISPTLVLAYSTPAKVKLVLDGQRRKKKAFHYALYITKSHECGKRISLGR